jgi:hypothetical protein
MKDTSATAKWMIDNPNDEPCPAGHSDAQMWRRRRGLEQGPREYRHVAEMARYEAAMDEKRKRGEQ